VYSRKKNLIQERGEISSEIIKEYGRGIIEVKFK
jgi:hypothetical protein